MQFLLLLSALLSAVTGAFAAPRPERAPVGQVEAHQIAAAPAPARAIVLVARPESAHPTVAESAVLAVREAPAPILPSPLDSVRRTE